MRLTSLVILLICTGCIHSRPTPSRVTSLISYEAESVIDSLWMHKLPNSLLAQGQLSMKTPLYSGALIAEISHRSADSLLMIFRIQGFGIEGGRLLVTPDSLFFYDRFSQTLRTAESNHPALPSFFSVQNALGKMLGFVRPPRGVNLKIRSSRDGLVLEDSLLHRTYAVDPNYWRVVHMTQHDSLGTLMEALHYDNFFDVNGSYFPRQVIYRNPLENTNAILNYRSLAVNDSIPSMSLDLPIDTERVELPKE